MRVLRWLGPAFGGGTTTTTVTISTNVQVRLHVGKRRYGMHSRGIRMLGGTRTVSSGEEEEDMPAPGDLARGGYFTNGGVYQIFSGAYEQFTDFGIDFDPVGNMPLDLTDPDNPAALVDGIYAVSLEVGVRELDLPQAGKFCYLELDIATPNLAMDQELQAVSGGDLNLHLAGTFFLAAGQTITVYFQHDVGSDIRAVVRHMYVQRVL